jgi:UDP-N-acetylglucosamine diphosphorylase/glucosamine-1-phosphate N-acetyltransferase
MNYILFDPAETWEDLLPLTWTRPISEIRIGILTIREKWEKHLGTTVSWLTRDFLRELFPVNLEEDNILINGSILPDLSVLKLIEGLEKGEVISTQGIVITARLGRNEAEEFVPNAETSKTSEHEPRFISHPWNIFRMNGEAIISDFELLTHGRRSQSLSSTNQCLNSENIFLEEGARVECSILNAETGPIYIGKDAEIMEGSLVRGPFAICEEATLKMGAKIYGPTTIGPFCKAGGEINNSVLFANSNKGHDGFLGNSVIGEWCNIGADSNNSNLKNNYASVKLWNYRKERFIDTELQFCGLIMGDHSKCGINTMFNTGTVVGVNVNIFGDGFPRNFIPSFSWGGPQGYSTYHLPKAFEVVEKVMERRDKNLTEEDKKLLTDIFDLTKKYRS